MPETLLIIGDVHGCFHTFRSLVETHWQPETMRLIQLGDLTDRGRFVPETIAFARDLDEKHPNTTVFLKGNHEADVIARWKMIQDAMQKETDSRFAQYYIKENSTMIQYFAREQALARLQDDMLWLEKRPYYWENDHVFVSHAGISSVWDTREEALLEDHPESILWTRSLLKNIGKLQVIGHTPISSGQPEFRPDENCWNIDTGAVFGLNLTALHLSPEGELLEIFTQPTLSIDYQRR